MSRGRIHLRRARRGRQAARDRECLGPLPLREREAARCATGDLPEGEGEGVTGCGRPTLLKAKRFAGSYARPNASLWVILRGTQVVRSKFRRQQPIGPFHRRLRVPGAAPDRRSRRWTACRRASDARRTAYFSKARVSDASLLEQRHPRQTKMALPTRSSPRLTALTPLSRASALSLRGERDWSNNG